jgi:hypothetical protein
VQAVRRERAAPALARGPRAEHEHERRLEPRQRLGLGTPRLDQRDLEARAPTARAAQPRTLAPTPASVTRVRPASSPRPSASSLSARKRSGA